MTVVVIVELHNCVCKIGLERLTLLMTFAFSVQPAAEDVGLAKLADVQSQMINAHNAITSDLR